MIHNFVSFSADGATSVPPSNTPLGLDGDVFDSGFQVDDPTSPDFSFVANIVNEMFSRVAADVFLHPRTKNEDISETHDEDPDPTYMGRLALKAYFQPQPLEFELTQWGVDLKNKMEIVFLRTTILGTLGERMLKPGDLIEAPYRSLSETRPKYYRVLNAQETGNYRYQWFYITTQTELLPGDVTIRPPTDNAQPQNDFPLDL